MREGGAVGKDRDDRDRQAGSATANVERPRRRSRKAEWRGRRTPSGDERLPAARRGEELGTAPWHREVPRTARGQQRRRLGVFGSVRREAGLPLMTGDVAPEFATNGGDDVAARAEPVVLFFYPRTTRRHRRDARAKVWRVASSVSPRRHRRSVSRSTGSAFLLDQGEVVGCRFGLGRKKNGRAKSPRSSSGRGVLGEVKPEGARENGEAVLPGRGSAVPTNDRSRPR